MTLEKKIRSSYLNAKGHLHLRKQAAQKPQKRTTVYSELILEHPGFISLILAISSSVLSFFIFIFQCGRAIYFNIPINEVPIPNSIEEILLYLVGVSLLLISNGFVFLASMNTDQKRRFKKLKACFLVNLVVLIFFLLYEVFIDHFNLYASLTGNLLTLIICSILITFLSVILFSIPFYIFGLVAYLLVRSNQIDTNEKNLENKVESNELVGTIMQRFSDLVRSFTLKHAAEVVTITMIVLIIAIPFFGMRSASDSLFGQKMIVYENTPYLIAFDNSDKYCAKPCKVLFSSKGEPNKIIFYQDSYEWISKDSLSVAVLKSHIEIQPTKASGRSCQNFYNDYLLSYLQDYV